MGKFKVLDLHRDIQEYDKYIIRCPDKTPYHRSEYLLAEEKAEEGHTKIFLYDNGTHFALLPVVVKKISELPYMKSLKKQRYDLITPHEYGGMITDHSQAAVGKELLNEISLYCKNKDIIFQFIRINPYLTKLPSLMAECGFEVMHSCSQVYVNLEQSEEQIMYGYKSNVRRNVKKAVREGLKFEIADKSNENIHIFQKMYQEAMRILEARRFLYFNDIYFQELIACSCSRLAIVKSEQEQIIAAGIILLGDAVAYYHLGCFDRAYASKRPMNYLMHYMIHWAKENGYKIFHLGGGGKSLMQFKTGYSDSRIDYCIAYQICNMDEYQSLCKIWQEQFPQYEGEEFYPLYRYNE